jgi:Peptidase family S41
MKTIGSALLFLFTFYTVKLTAQNKSTVLNGDWYFEMLHNDIGHCNFYMHFEITNDSTFIAYTRKNADKDFLGNFKSFAARNFAGMFKGGSLARIVKGKYNVKQDSIVLNGVFTNPIANAYFQAYIIKEKMVARLSNGKKIKTADLRGRHITKKESEHDYPAIVDKALLISNVEIFNPSVTKEKKWKTFEKEIKVFSFKAQDDLEMVFGFYYFKEKTKLSHFALLKIPDTSEDMNANRKERHTNITERDKSTVLLNIKSLSGSAEEIDSVFKIIIDKQYENLIIDLRGNTGGSVEAGLPLVKNLIDKPISGGIFLTRKWFDKNNYIPKPEQYQQFEAFSESNYDAIINGIHTKEGLYLKVEPNTNVYKGKVFILTNKATASTCEPIVYGLKKENRAIIVGENTAGAMLNGERFNVSNGYQLLIPTADFYTSDGTRIEGKGVKPNYIVKSGDALNYVLSNLIK